MRIPRAAEEEEYELVAEAANLYYIDRITQGDVAKKLGISQSKVARLLERARNENIAETFINLPPLLKTQSDLEYCLGQRGVDKVSLAPSGEGKNTRFLGMAGARVLLAVLLGIESQTIRIVTSCGETLGAVIEFFIKLKALEPEAFEKLKDKKLELYPAALYADSRLIEGIYPHTLVSFWWARMRNFSDEPSNIEAYVPSLPPNFYKMDIQSRNEFLEFHGINEIISNSKKADIFLLGIGTIQGHSYKRIEKQIDIPVDDQEFYAESNFIPIRKDGSQHEEFAKHIIGLHVEDYREISKNSDQHVIAIAGGNKLEAIETALVNPFFNIFVTDRNTALHVLKTMKK